MTIPDHGNTDAKQFNVCSIPGCGKKVKARGWCNPHRQRWYKLGSPTAGGPEYNRDIPDRFFEGLFSTDPSYCWLWMKGKMPEGYGKLWLYGRTELTHRISYLLFHAAIPEGLQLDHLCRNRACCNPEHLEPVTRKVNILRGNAPHAIHARKTHCPSGHPYDAENTRLVKGGGRYCHACQLAHKRAYRARLKSKGAGSNSGAS